jgi:probable F420-dependent oxidoreductase
MRFHQAVAFLETDQLLELCPVVDATGYAGIYVSDHIFYPRELKSRYTYSPYEDGSPIWSPDADWPDSWCLISAMAAVTERITFTTGVYIAPARDLYTVAKLVGTAAVISRNRVRLGVGVGWCKEEFVATGQEFHNRGRRLDDMIPALRAMWQRSPETDGWVEYHGSHYDVPAMRMNPAPTAPVPIFGGGHSEPALARAARLCDGWLAGSAYTVDEAWHYLDRLREHMARHGREGEIGNGFAIYLALGIPPDLDVYRRFEDAGVTDVICAPWMVADVSEKRDYRSALDAKVAATEAFATDVIAKMG